MHLEPWQIVGLALIAALIGGMIVRVGTRRQFDALHQRFIIAGSDLAEIRGKLDSSATRSELIDAADRIIERLDPERLRERREQKLRATIPNFGAG
jgi:hypothetical protein